MITLVLYRGFFNEGGYQGTITLALYRGLFKTPVVPDDLRSSPGPLIPGPFHSCRWSKNNKRVFAGFFEVDHAGKPPDGVWARYGWNQFCCPPWSEQLWLQRAWVLS